MNLFRRLFQEFDAVAAYAQVQEVGNVLGSGLLNGVVDRVAAAFVHADRVGHADAVAQGDAVLLARAAAVRVIRSFAKEGTINAVFGMEHRQMLMNYDFEQRGVRMPKHIDHLLNVQVIGRRNAIQTRGGEQFHRFVVSDVQREVADKPWEGFAPLGGFCLRLHVELQRAGIADKHRVRLQL